MLLQDKNAQTQCDVDSFAQIAKQSAFNNGLPACYNVRQETLGNMQHPKLKNKNCERVYEKVNHKRTMLHYHRDHAVK